MFSNSPDTNGIILLHSPVMGKQSKLCLSVEQISVIQMSTDQMSVGQVSISQMSASQKSVDLMHAGKKSVAQIFVGQINVTQMYVGLISISHMLLAKCLLDKWFLTKRLGTDTLQFQNMKKFTFFKSMFSNSPDINGIKLSYSPLIGYHSRLSFYSSQVYLQGRVWPRLPKGSTLQ
jgi:hypothetical protein